MDNGFDIYTLLFLILAVVIFLRLRNVLGRRTGDERPPYDPYAASDGKSNGTQRGGQDTVVPLPRRNTDTSDAVDNLQNRIKKFAPKDSPLANGLIDIGKNDPSFDPAQFLDAVFHVCPALHIHPQSRNPAVA